MDTLGARGRPLAAMAVGLLALAVRWPLRWLMGGRTRYIF